MAGCVKNEAAIKEMGKARLARDEDDVKKVLSVLSSWTNPFATSDLSDDLYHLASGALASDVTAQDTLAAKEKGQQALVTYIKERLIDKNVSVYEVIPRMKLRGFNIASKKICISGKDVSLKADRHLFARLLVIAQTREMNLRDVLQYSLGPLPWSLAASDGSLAKTDKSKLLEPLVDQVEPVEDVPPNAAWVVDGMAVLQSLGDIPATFGDLAVSVFNAVVQRTGMTSRIDFVTDTYPEISIKNVERAKRACHGTVKVKITGPGQRCPKQWKKFLGDGENKTVLTAFLLQQWCSNSYAGRIGNRVIYFASGDGCIKILVINGRVVCEEIDELRCSHEEADTRMLLHAKHAAENGEATVIIRSPDTDVIMLACHFQERIPATLLVLKQTKSRTFFLDIPSMVEKVGSSMCDALPGFHAFTGCDFTSAFVGKGKKGPFRICLTDRKYCEAMAQLGGSFDVDSVMLAKAERFVCRMYGSGETSVNECRYQFFCTRNPQSHSLPPCQDALIKHTQRSNYQAAVWRNALVAEIELPSPENHGWQITDNNISIDWMSLPPAPEALLDLIVCACTGQCVTGHCSCNRNGLSCTEACQCGDSCSNPSNEYQQESESDDSDGEEDTVN